MGTGTANELTHFTARKHLVFLITFLGMVIHICLSTNADETLITDEAEAREFLDYFNTEVQVRNAKMMNFNWNFDTNMTAYNQQRRVSGLIRTKVDI